MSGAVEGINNRGAIFRIFGVILLILGALDTMLSWRGGLEVQAFHAGLIGVGVLLCVIGAIRRHIGAGHRI